MTKFYKVLILSCVLVLFVNSERVSYKGYKLYEVYPHNEDQAQHLKAQEENSGIHFLSHVFRGGLSHPVKVLVSPKAQVKFSDFLANRSIKCRVVIANFERTLQRERIRTKRAAVLPGEINFDGYHTYEVITDYLKKLARKYSHIVSLLNIGQTTEGRDILALKISNGKPKSTILIDAGVHAREWIAPAQALYVIQQLVENSDNKNLIRNIDWIIIPSLNPDGYEYTHTTDRLWRKTRSRGITNCTGTDINRNFDFHWGEKRGSKDDECSDTYHGPTAFSEPETRAFRDLVFKYADQVKLAVNFHSFSQMILYPWSYTYQLPSNAAELFSLGSDVAKAIEKVSGTHYVVGSVSNVLYYASGDSIDWLMGVAGINLTYTIELPPTRYDPIEFELPSNSIKRVVSETFEGVKVFHSYIEDMYT